MLLHVGNQAVGLVRAVPTAWQRPAAGCVEALRHQVLGRHGAPAQPLHAVAEFAHGGQSGLDVGIGGAALFQFGNGHADMLRGHIAQPARALVGRQGVEQRIAAPAVGAQGAIAVNRFPVGSILLGRVAALAGTEDRLKRPVDLVDQAGSVADDPPRFVGQPHADGRQAGDGPGAAT
jgi:hypothetical protein